MMMMIYIYKLEKIKQDKPRNQQCLALELKMG